MNDPKFYQVVYSLDSDETEQFSQRLNNSEDDGWKGPRSDAPMSHGTPGSVMNPDSSWPADAGNDGDSSMCRNNCGRRAADGYPDCCRTCRQTNGKSHGQVCNAAAGVPSSAPMC